MYTAAGSNGLCASAGRGIKCCQPGRKRMAAGVYHESAAHVCGADRVDGFEKKGKGLRTEVKGLRTKAKDRVQGVIKCRIQNAECRI